MRRAALLTACLLVFPACFSGTGDDPAQTRPIVSLDFPASLGAGEEATATLEVENPGPDIGTLTVAFALLGGADLPQPLIGFGAKGENPSVVSVEPEPTGVSQDGVVYRFDALPEGETVTIEFVLRAPVRRGSYANSVTVSDGEDVERSRGVPLRTQVEG